MSFASYLEDIINKTNEFSHFLEEQNKVSDKKIDIHQVLGFRKECESILKKVKEIGEIDEIIPKYLKLENENKKLKTKIVKLKSKTDNSDKNISNLENRISNLISENEANKKTLETFKQRENNEASKREELEDILDERYRQIYQNKLNASEKNLSDFKFEIINSINKIEEIVNKLIQNPKSDLISELKYKIKHLIKECQ